MANVKFLVGTAEKYQQLVASGQIVAENFYRITDSETPNDMYIGKRKLTSQEDVQKALNAIGSLNSLTTEAKANLVVAINEVANAIGTLKGSETDAGSIAKAIKDAIGKLDNATPQGTGTFVKGVTETDGIITVTMGDISADEVPDLAISKITGLQGALNAKQDNLVFMNNNYDKENNKVATASDLAAATGGLAGAMHFKGTVSELPTDTSSYASGDVILVGNKEYVFNGTAFVELGDESIYAVKGSIKDSDIAGDAAIAQSKIAGLTDALDGKAPLSDFNNLKNYVGEASAEGKNATGLTAKVEALETAVGTGGSVDTKISNAIGALDSEASHTVVPNGDGLALSVKQVDGKITEISGSIENGTYDEYGAASAALEAAVGNEGDVPEANTIYGARAAAAAVLGTASDAKEANTVYGAKAATAAVLGTSSDTKEANTVYGVKKYAESLVNTSLTWETF